MGTSEVWRIVVINMQYTVGRQCAPERFDNQEITICAHVHNIFMINNFLMGLSLDRH